MITWSRALRVVFYGGYAFYSIYCVGTDDDDSIGYKLCTIFIWHIRQQGGILRPVHVGQI